MFHQLHGKTYFRTEHYLPASVLDKIDQTTIKEELPKLHSSYYNASEQEAELEFLKVRNAETHQSCSVILGRASWLAKFL